MPSDPSAPWGPENPHPLSLRRTELIWEGKYDEYGNRRPVRLPANTPVLQRVEAVAPCLAGPKLREDFRNRLIWGDNKLALAALLGELRGQVELITIDPPFDVGTEFAMSVALGEEGSTADKRQSAMECVAYRDTWGRGTDSYLHMMFERLSLMRELLSDTGNILVHCDWRVSGTLKQLLEEVFGKGCFRNEIVWYYRRWSAPSRLFQRYHDSIYWFSKGSRYTFNEVREVPANVRKGRHESYERDEEGRLYRWQSLHGKRYKIYRHEEGVLCGDVWEIPFIHPSAHERTEYSTQKPEALLDRILRACSNEGGLVLDCFCGSGTALAVAEKLGRRWIGVDLGRHAIHTTRKRLIGVQRELQAAGQPCRAFDVYHLGQYERRWWLAERLRGSDAEYRAAVLRLFRATPHSPSPSPLLHGQKAGAFVHAAGIDSLFTLEEARAVASAAAAAGGRQVICLAWAFEMGLAQRVPDLARELGVAIRLKCIPREAMEPGRGEVPFFDAGAIEAEALVTTHPETGERRVDVRLKGFIPSLAGVPERKRAALRERAAVSPLDFIDFWAVDFDHPVGKDLFEHHWQAYRTRKERSLPTETDCGHVYPGGGRKRVAVKAVDVFGVECMTVVDVTL